MTVMGQANPNSLQTAISNGTTVANATLTITLGALPGKTTYVSGFEITGLGATAVTTVTATLATLNGGQTFSYSIAVPAGVTTGIQPVQVQFVPAIPATAVNTVITLTVPAFGAGNTLVCGTLHGWRE
jgi:hypothetical protein